MLVTYVLWSGCALGDIAAGSFSEGVVPDQVLGAVEAAPVPVSAHHGADEVGVVRVRSSVVEEGAGLDMVSRRGDCSGSKQARKGSEKLHGVGVALERTTRCLNMGIAGV